MAANRSIQVETSGSPSVLADYGFVVFAPGTTQVRSSLPQHPAEVRIRDRNTDRLTSIQLWSAWGIATTDLIERHDDLAADTFRPDAGALSAELAFRRALANVLGLGSTEPDWPGSPFPGRRPEQWEVVLVGYAGVGFAPSIVVSPDAYNRQRLDTTMLVRCLPRTSQDVDDPLVIPFETRDAFTFPAGDWSIAVHKLRGQTRVKQLIRNRVLTLPTEPYKLDIQQPEVHRDLVERLRWFYA